MKEDLRYALIRVLLFSLAFAAGCVAYIVLMGMLETIIFMHSAINLPRIAYFLPGVVTVGGLLYTRRNPLLGGFCGGIVCLGCLFSLYLWDTP